VSFQQEFIVTEMMEMESNIMVPNNSRKITKLDKFYNLKYPTYRKDSLSVGTVSQLNKVY
jgi:hypothetical protein